MKTYQKEKYLSELKKYYALCLGDTMDDRLLRRRNYLTLRTFCLDCSLLTFEEIELMEYEIKNN